MLCPFLRRLATSLEIVSRYLARFHDAPFGRDEWHGGRNPSNREYAVDVDIKEGACIQDRLSETGSWAPYCYLLIHLTHTPFLVC